VNISRTRRVIINMGNYGERYEAGATASLSHQDLGYSDEEWLERIADIGPEEAFKDLNATTLKLVNEQLAIEVSEALEIRDSDEPSFVDVYEPPKIRSGRKKRS